MRNPSERDLSGQASHAQDALTRALAEVRRVSRPWSVHPRLPTRQLTGIPQGSRLRAQLLHNRGLPEGETTRAFLAANWRATGPISSQLEKATERITRALTTDERITVYGDFDCDGISSCALLVETLRALAKAPDRVSPYIPERTEEGRGLNVEAIRAIAAEGSTLIVTCDCGSANVEEVALAGELGVQVIITDHHPPHGPLPVAFAVVNPRAETDPAAHCDLAGVGVAFRLAEALLSQATNADDSLPATRPLPDDFLSSLLDLVAIGTVGDVAPLSAENWALVRAGVQRLNENPRPGVRALIAQAGLAAGKVSSRDISFAIAPRLNAAGRLESPMLALRLLLTRDPREIESLATTLESLNRARQQQTEEILTAARSQVRGQSGALIAQSESWRQGVLGLVAGRLAEETGLPTFLLSRQSGRWRGSARGPEGVDLGAVLAARPDFFAHFGGHARAAGFTLVSEDASDFLAYVRERFLMLAAPTTTIEEDDGAGFSGGAALEVDCELPLHALRDDHYETIEALEPYGPGFAEPVFLAPRVRIVGTRRSGLGSANLRLRLQSGGEIRDAVWSKRGELDDALRPALTSLPAMDVVYHLSRYYRTDKRQVEWLVRILAMSPSQ